MRELTLAKRLYKHCMSDEIGAIATRNNAGTCPREGGVMPSECHVRGNCR